MNKQLKKGYKQTEIGLIPEDWVCVNMGDVGKTIIGLTYSPNDVRDYGTLVLRSSNIQQNKLKYDNNVFVEMDLPQRVIVRENDILICVRNGSKHLIGKCALIDKNAEGYAFGAFMSIYRSEFSKFIFYSFQSNIIQKQIDETMGATINQLTNKNLAEFQIPLPPLPEQQAIATILTDTDNLINSLTQQLDKKRAIKQGAMQELLKPKEDWEVKTLGEIGEGIIGLTYSPNDVKKSGTLVLRSSNVQNGYLSFEDNVFVEMNLPERIIVKENDILICVRNGSKRLIGKCALIDKKTEGSAFGAFMTIYRSQYSKYIFYVFQSHYIQRQIDEVMGATINQITNKDLNSFEVPFPPIEEQTRIATILSDMDVEIAKLEEKLAKYRVVKQGLMQQLLTGNIRVV
ncbi:restriction endonuclease subunit S [Tenacibaculum sp. TC6]|uniref:restriction endonuclease subunit S n=1 Tax=Tenacibaculum sp. TC6 TaxID=3423223 RepID=UPI003D360783